jgi:DNA-binding GntR family transcriptional regulator
MSATGAPAGQGQGLAGTLADRLRAAIWNGELAPGERLVERRLARQFGVSHIPLREALARLVEEGLVVRLPRRGARVASLSAKRLEEISSLRVVLEQFVITQLHGRVTVQARAGLQGIVNEMTAAAARRDLVAVHELDQRFHEKLWELTDHALLVELAGQLRSRITHFFRAAAESLGPDEMLRHARSHQDLLDVIASGDAAAAQQEMARHIRAATQRITDARLARAEED